MQLLKALNHPNIVSCHESFIEGGKLCIIMDYCSGGANSTRTARWVLKPMYTSL